MRQAFFFVRVCFCAKRIHGAVWRVIAARKIERWLKRKVGGVPHQNLKDPLHGVTLKVILGRLVEQIGWKGLAASIPVRCFMFEPTLTSSLRFLRQTPWARTKVEALYVKVFKKRFCESVTSVTKGKQ